MKEDGGQLRGSEEENVSEGANRECVKVYDVCVRER